MATHSDKHLSLVACGVSRSLTVVSWSALLLSALSFGWLISLQLGWMPAIASSHNGYQAVANKDASLTATTAFTTTPTRTTNPGTVAGFSTLIADVAEQLAPSVVNIDVSSQPQRRAESSDGPQGLPFSDDIFRYFFGGEAPQGGRGLPPGFGPMEPRPGAVRTGNGSGVIFDADGHILTNYHVVAQADTVNVTLNNGKKYPAKVVGTDPMTDLAVVKIEATGLKAAPFGVSKSLRPGDWVIAIGSPLGFDHTVTLGIVSAKSRQIPDINSNVDFIQTDAAINPGNSGGPLVNLSGQVIGINTAISGRGQNIGFAIPSDTVRDIALTLVKDGAVKRPMIGITMTALTPELSQGLGLSPNETGVVVGNVVPNSPASAAGFQRGDVIQRAEGKPITDPQQVQAMVRQKPIGSTISFQILRDGQMKGLKVTTQTLKPEQITQWH